ncbi:MAG: ATP-binding protein [Fibrobacterota bacterium]
MDIYIIDDDTEVCRYISRFLRGRGYTSEYNTDPFAALHYLQSRADDQPVIILLDLNMPGLNGVEFVERLGGRKRHFCMHIIMLTGSVDNSDYVHSLEAGADDFLHKPFRPEHLTARINTGIRSLNLKQELKENARDLADKNIRLEESLQELRQTQAHLVQQEKLASIGELAAGISHEINNPVGFIKSNTDILTGYLEELFAYTDQLEDRLSQQVSGFHRPREISFIREDLESIISENSEGIGRIEGIISNMKSFARVDRENKYEPLHLSKLIESTLVIARNRVKYVAELTTDLGDTAVIRGVAGELNQVVLNLLINAVQSVEACDDIEVGEIHISTEDRPGAVLCQVRDNGTGVSHTAAQHLFDLFFTTKKGSTGTGLGLSISQNIIVERHGGKIWFENNPDRGASFFIELPVTEEEYHE